VIEDEVIKKALEKATPDQLRSIALAVARFACERAELKDPVIELALLELQDRRYDDPYLKKGVERVAEHWDEYAFKMREIEEEKLAPLGITRLPDDSPFTKAHDMGFFRARAASSVLFAFHEDPFKAAKEGIYEAWHTSSDEDTESIRKIVLSIVEDEP